MTKPLLGDFLLDRYLPDASPEERERAREAFRRLALILVGIGERIQAESDEKKFDSPQGSAEK